MSVAAVAVSVGIGPPARTARAAVGVALGAQATQAQAPRATAALAAAGTAALARGAALRPFPAPVPGLMDAGAKDRRGTMAPATMPAPLCPSAVSSSKGRRNDGGPQGVHRHSSYLIVAQIK